MTMEQHASSRPLTHDEAFALTLLTSCEVTKNILTDRCPMDNKKRRYWLDKLDKDIEAVNRTYDGYLPDHFIAAAETYHAAIETAVRELMATYQTATG